MSWCTFKDIVATISSAPQWGRDWQGRQCVSPWKPSPQSPNNTLPPRTGAPIWGQNASLACELRRQQDSPGGDWVALLRLTLQKFSGGAADASTAYLVDGQGKLIAATCGTNQQPSCGLESFMLIFFSAWG